MSMSVECVDTIVLFGGVSSERRVSVASAQNLVRYLTNARWWYWTPEGAVAEVDAALLLAHQRPFRDDLVPAQAPCWGTIHAALDAAPKQSTFLLGLHGGDGENGTVQGWLEDRGLRFTGTDSAGSATAMHKAEAKKRVAAAGVSVATSRVFTPQSVHLCDGLHEFLDEHGSLVAKPLADGSSEGLLFVKEPAALATVEVAIREGVSYLLEAFVVGRELTVGVIDVPGMKARALAVSEVLLDEGRSFDFEGKYLGAGTQEITPADVPDAMAEEAQRIALTAHRVLGCSGYSRTDVIATDNEVVFLETNTLPGLTAPSFYPQQLEAAGVSMRSFLTGLLARARED